MSSYADLYRMFFEHSARMELNEYVRLQMIAIRPWTNENKIH